MTPPTTAASESWTCLTLADATIDVETQSCRPTQHLCFTAQLIDISAEPELAAAV